MGPESRVAILLEPSPAMLVAVIGVLKAGAAYVPLDPAFPKDRIAYILEQSASLDHLIWFRHGGLVSSSPKSLRRDFRRASWKSR